MSVVVPADQVIPALERENARVTTLLRSGVDASATAIGFWSVRDLAAHMSHVWELMAAALDDRDSPVTEITTLTGYYNRRVSEEPGRDPSVFADKLDASCADIVASLTERPDGTGRWHAGWEVPRTVLAGVPLSEAVIHGQDLAGAAGRKLSPPRAHAALAMRILAHLLPLYVTERAKGKDLAFRMHPRGGRSFDVLVRDGALAVDDDSGRAIDCHVSADPLTYLLVGFNRIPVSRAILTGRVLSYGRKPWLGLELPRLITSP